MGFTKIQAVLHMKNYMNNDRPEGVKIVSLNDKVDAENRSV